ncbi:Aldo/keto reductase [Acaromyces ingoldii]|uniref:Aldo/keto reductase n=1 Tax=Acaromyces ingoldii TaxID=215250 RepID=A0A316YT49_9BASI|nr:Aldo/keto reductase [Acaromyces ingoldii]PWN92587.1 Aldo/keto reductase [Acaromyces ingoldii]
MKTAVDSGCCFWDGGAFYGPPSDPTANLTLIRRFFQRFPGYKSKVFLCVKGGSNMARYQEEGYRGLGPDMSENNLRNDLAAIRQALGSDQDGHEVDMYAVARVDHKYTIKEWMSTLVKLQKEGLFTHICLSEVSSETVRVAAGIAPIAAVEVEYSLWETSVESNGVLAACQELRIPLIAYSPIGKGILGGRLSSREQLVAGDNRLFHERYSEENFAANLELARSLAAKAEQMKCTPAQLCLAWVLRQDPQLVIALPGTTKVDNIKQNASAMSFELSDQEDRDIRSLVSRMGVSGGRYNSAIRDRGILWG